MRVDFKAVHDIFLGSVILFELVWHTVERQILVVFGVVNVFERIKDLRSKLTLVLIIVLGGDMDNELDAAIAKHGKVILPKEYKEETQIGFGNMNTTRTVPVVFKYRDESEFVHHTNHP